MPKIDSGPTLFPHFRDFLPQWVAGQPWYLGSSAPSLRAIGFLRFEDPAGQVGIETHLVSDGAQVYQLPLTYRGAPLEGIEPVAVAEHSVLGRRWIYDGTTDPVWAVEVIALVNGERAIERTARNGIGNATARGILVAGREIAPEAAAITLHRVLTAAGEPAPEPGVLGLIVGTWQPQGPAGITDSGHLATIRAGAGALAGAGEQP